MRRPISGKANKRVFAKGRKVNKANMPKMTRGGYRK